MLNTEGEPQALAWAGYALNGMNRFDRLDAVQLFAGRTQPGTGSVFLGISDYNRNAWHWIQVDVPDVIPGDPVLPQIVPIPRELQPVTPDEQAVMSLVVATFGQPIRIDRLAVLADEVAPPPVNIRASEGSRTDGILLTWDDPDQTYSAFPPAQLEFEYEAINIYRYSKSQLEYVLIATVPSGVTSYLDADPGLGPMKHSYGLRTVVSGSEGRMGYGGMSGWVGIAPEAHFSVHGTAPNFTLDPLLSFDADDGGPDSVLAEYRWTAFLPSSPDYKYEFVTYDEQSVEFTLNDLTQINRIQLQVLDQEGLLSTPPDQMIGAAGFYLWSPNLGCVQDDPTEPDPKELVQGSGSGTYTVGLRFDVSCGNPNYRFEFDSHFDGTFGPGPKGANGQNVPVVMLKDFATAPNVDGSLSIVANVPANQPNGVYYMAVRVTDENGDESVYMWPDKVTLEPQN